ncbi:MAG: hypothetical protein RQ754_10195 [Desulfuromonadales bacterium]|nr:hypothetical protein [Desulfuromonadales bacterium]
MLYDMSHLQRYLKDSLHLNELAIAAADIGMSCWLVGGALRDLFLGRPVTDIDIAAPEDPSPLARRWAKSQGGHWFWLDKERLQSRVLLRSGKLPLTFDFAPLRAPSIDRDLQLRDFSINAFALALVAPLSEQPLLDPLQGLKDLQNGILRQCSSQSLLDDPLRILKGIRHCTALDLAIEKETTECMKKYAHLLSRSAGERKRTELGRILAAEDPIRGLSLLDKYDLLEGLLCSSKVSIAGSSWLEEWPQNAADLDAWTQRLPDLFAQTFDEVFTRKSLYLITKILRSSGAVNVASCLRERIRFSRQSVTIIDRLVSFCPDTMLSLDLLPDSKRARALWLHGLGKAPIDQLLYFAIFEQPGRIPADRISAVIADYTGLLTAGRIPALLSGSEIKRLLPELNDKQIGTLQAMINQAEMTGEISSVKDAKDYLLAENSIDKI